MATSHSVIRTTIKVNGEGQNMTPTSPKSLIQLSPKFAQVITIQCNTIKNLYVRMVSRGQIGGTGSRQGEDEEVRLTGLRESTGKVILLVSTLTLWYVLQSNITFLIFAVVVM